MFYRGQRIERTVIVGWQIEELAKFVASARPIPATVTKAMFRTHSHDETRTNQWRRLPEASAFFFNPFAESQRNPVEIQGKAAMMTTETSNATK
jgi:hypothetical protein